MGLLSRIFAGGGYEPAAIYTELRNQVLDLAREPGNASVEPSALLMESGMRDGCYSLVAHADGTASLTFSNGGGVIGGGAHRRCAEAARALLAASGEFEDALAPVRDCPLPEPGRIRFSLIRPGQIRSASFKERDLANDRSELSPLFHRGHELIAVIRHVSQVRESEDPLVIAIFDEDPARAKALLGEGADPNTRTSGGRPVLSMAAAADRAELVDVLLAGGAALDGADDSGLSALMTAAHVGAEAALARLLEARPDLEQRDESGYTALMFAANAGRLGCATRLVRAGADVHATDRDRSTPIMFAAQHAANDVVRLLLEHDADPLFEGDHGLSAVGFAEQNGHTTTLQLLLG